MAYWHMEKPSKTQPARVIRVRLLIEWIRYMKFDWKNSIHILWKYIQSNKWKEVLGDFPEIINFLNTSYQTNERKYSQDFQCKLMISVNSDNQTSFQLFYWNEIREWKLYWKFFHSNFIWLVWLEYFSDIINYYCIFSFTLQEQHNLMYVSANSPNTSFHLFDWT